MGEESYTGWGAMEWLALDTRNALEGLRSTVVSMASGKGGRDTFRAWKHYPGYEQSRQAKRVAKVNRLAAMATQVTE